MRASTVTDGRLNRHLQARVTACRDTSDHDQPSPMTLRCGAKRREVLAGHGPVQSGLGVNFELADHPGMRAETASGYGYEPSAKRAR